MLVEAQVVLRLGCMVEGVMDGVVEGAVVVLVVLGAEEGVVLHVMTLLAHQTRTYWVSGRLQMVS